MTITHIVLFKFSLSAESAKVNETAERMIGLKNECVHPETGEKYIVSGKGGKNNSPEGHDQGLTHGFVVEFENEEDRDYYLNKDPAHLSFVKDITSSGLVEGITVIDFVDGVL